MEFEWKTIHRAIDFRESRKQIFGDQYEPLSRKNLSKNRPVKYYLKIIRDIEKDCLERFEKDPIYRGALLHFLYLLADTCISLAQMVLKFKGERMPQSYHESIELLGEKGLLDKGFALDFAGIAGFRNFLARDYERISKEFICKIILPKLKEVEEYLSQIEKAL